MSTTAKNWKKYVRGQLCRYIRLQISADDFDGIDVILERNKRKSIVDEGDESE